MPSLGELFIQLGVIGDTKELDVLQKRLDKAAKATADFVKSLDDEINYQFKLSRVTGEVAEAKARLAKATDEEARKEAESALATAEKTKKMLEERKAAQEAAKVAKASAEANQENINGKKELAKNIAGVVKGLGALVGAATIAVAALNKMTDSLTTQNQAWVNFTRQTDLSLQSLQKWGSIGNIVDKSLGEQGLAGTLADLNERIYDLILTGQGAEGFMLAGISPLGTDAEGVLEQLRDRIQGLDNTSATYLLKKMGLDPRILPVLRMTREEFNALNEEMKNYRLTDKQRNGIDQMNRQLQIAAQKIQYLKDRAILAILPAWTQFVQSMAPVAEGLARIANWLTTTNAGAVTLGATIGSVLIPAIKALYAVITSHPIVAAITAIIGVLYLLIDDIVGYFQGKNSGIGYIINWFDDIGEKLASSDIVEKMEAFVEIIKVLFKMGVPPVLQAIIQAAEILSKFIDGQDKSMIDRVYDTGKAIGEGLSQIGDNLGEKIKKWQDNGGLISLGANLDPGAMVSRMMPLSNSLYNSNIYNYDQRAISQNNVINTQQPATDIQNELLAANAYFAMV